MTIQEKIIYLAGIFDGEGCVLIVVRPSRDGRSPQYAVVCEVNMQDGAPIKMLQELFGGIYHIRKKSGNYPAAEWLVSSQKAKKFIEAIIPYSTVKKEQLLVALEFISNCKNKVRKGCVGSDRKLSKEEITIQQNYKERLSGLKKIHII